MLKLSGFYEECTGNIEKSTKINDNGIFSEVDIYFPYKPYGVQKDYMKTVLNALCKKENALLESPTGSGKTMCLLTSCLAFLKVARQMGDADIKIVYMSRTHSQLQQVIKELKKSAYRPKMMILGSRDHTCVKDSLSQFSGNIKKIKCRNLVVTGGCQYFENLKTNASNPIQDTIFDIEDLLVMGKKATICPFYFSKKRVDNGDIVFMPYNYILDRQQRSGNISLIANAILIFDEAHNIQSSAEEGSSISIAHSDITAGISELEHILGMDNKYLVNHNSLKSVINILTNVGDSLKDKAKTSKSTEQVCDVLTLFEFIKTCSNKSITLSSYMNKKDATQVDIF